MASRRITRIDRRLSVPVKIGVLVTLVSIAAATILGFVTLSATARRIDESYEAKAQEAAQLVEEQIVRHPTDYQETDRLLSDLVRTQPSLMRIRVVRNVNGVAGLWASSYPTDVAIGIPSELITLPRGDVVQGATSLAGQPTFLTAIGVALPNDIRSIDVYASPQQRVSALAEERRAVTTAAAVVIGVQLVVLLTAMYLFVIRRIRRLERAAAAVAAGDLSVRLPEGSTGMPGRLGDEIDRVAIEFDRMVRTLEAREQRQDSVVQLGRLALSGLDLQPLFDEAVRAVAAQVRADVVVLFGEQGPARLVVRAETGFPKGHSDVTAPADPDSSHPGRVLHAGIAVDVDPDMKAGALLDKLGVRSGMGVPVMGPGESAWGVLGAYNRGVRESSVEDTGYLEAVANVLAAAIGQRTVLERERETERRFRMVVENAAELIALVDRSGKLVYASPAFVPLLGLEQKDLLDVPLVDLAHPADVGTLGRAIVDVSIGGLAEQRGLRLRREAGGHLTVDATIAPIIDDAASIRMLLFIAHDVSEQVNAQEDRRQLLARLLSAQEEERTRIAGDIHDDPIQAMTAVSFRLEALRNLVDSPEADEVLTRVAGSVSTAVERLRHLMFELRPPSLDHIGIAAALKEYVRKEAQDDGFSFSLIADLPREPDSETRAIVYRLAQEALINVRKHARAQRVDVTLTSVDGGVSAKVHDDGAGFHPGNKVEAGHMGLMSMRERAHLAGGWFTVDSVPGGGTTIEFWIPQAGRSPNVPRPGHGSEPEN